MGVGVFFERGLQGPHIVWVLDGGPGLVRAHSEGFGFDTGSRLALLWFQPVKSGRGSSACLAGRWHERASAECLSPSKHSVRTG